MFYFYWMFPLQNFKMLLIYYVKKQIKITFIESIFMWTFNYSKLCKCTKERNYIRMATSEILFRLGTLGLDVTPDCKHFCLIYLLSAVVNGKIGLIIDEKVFCE